jgi:hypothetical protein
MFLTWNLRPDGSNLPLHPTDFREQIQNRVIREDSDACLTLNFVPVEVRSDVRALVCGTLAGETGLVTGPQPMFQVWSVDSVMSNFRTVFFPPVFRLDLA